jgi:hypothetical protein
MSVPRQAFKRSLKKLYDYLDTNLSVEGSLPLNAPEAGDAGKVLVVNALEDDYELSNSPEFVDLEVTDDLTVGDDASVGGDLSVTGALTKDGVNVNADPYLNSSTDGALNTSGVNRLSKGSAGAYTLALPGVNDDGKQCIISSSSAFAHVVTVASAALHDGTGTTKNILTFTAQPGASIHLVAINQTWHLIAKNVVTLTAV